MNFIKKLFKPKMFALGLTMAVAGLLGYNTLTQSVVHALPQDCDDNSIIWCGFQNLNEFKSKYNTNATKDLKNLYAHNFNSSVANGGLSQADLDRYVSQGVQGWAWRDGRVTSMDGNTVYMTNAWSLGRQDRQDPRRVAIKVGTETYYKSILEVGFAPTTQKIPVFILFNDDGEVEFAAMNSCGNPVWGKNVKPEYKCKSLSADKINRNTFKFKTDTYEKNNANITKVEYDFGDGNKKEVTNKSEMFAYQHSYTKAGKYTVKVTVTVTLPGNKTKTFTSEYCVTEVTVEEEKVPVYACDTLSAKLISGKRKYLFELQATAKDGAKLNKVDFDFGDGQAANNIKPAVETGKILVKVEHEYDAKLTGKKVIKAKLDFSVANGVQSKQCQVEIELREYTCEDTPNAPECQPPVEECKPGIPKGDDACKEILPKEIVKTGPAEIAMSALGLGSVAGAGMYYRASRKNLLDKIFKR
ncbi:MAG TPA: PKD domain-containing protein [Candidatus Saccharimonadales bacterium]|nr:PKD domain-containing protein [Candidatus Saccharimonadales bacterium]